MRIGYDRWVWNGYGSSPEMAVFQWESIQRSCGFPMFSLVQTVVVTPVLWRRGRARTEPQTHSQWIGSRENLNRKPLIFQLNMGLSCQWIGLNQSTDIQMATSRVGGFRKNGGTLKLIHFHSIFHDSIINIYKPSILGYPHDYGNLHFFRIFLQKMIEDAEVCSSETSPPSFLVGEP